MQVKGFTSMTHYNFGAKVYSNATGDEASGCKKLPWTRNWKKLKTIPHGVGKSQEQELGYSGSTKR